MGRRVLIVSPHFPPFNAPDHQRVRMSLPYFRENGWEATVLAGRAEDAGSARDDLLEKTLPPDIPIHRVRAWSERGCRRFGFGHFGYRCIIPIHRSASRLLEREPFDLVYFSTTMFNTMALGPRWKRRFGVPYVIDLQDPWYAGPNCIYDANNAPGGLWKYRLSQMIARTLEPKTVRGAAAIISVSQGYIDTLSSRYGEEIRQKSHVIPFGAPERDFEMLPTLGVRQEVFDPGDGSVHWVCVGRAGGPGFDQVLSTFFEALRKIVSTFSKPLKLHFIGTSYADGQCYVRRLAAEARLQATVEEHPSRLPYFQALRALVDSHGILVLGANEPGYTASRLIPSLLAGRPLLALFHPLSTAASFLQRISPESLVPIVTGSSNTEALSRKIAEFYRRTASGERPCVDVKAFSAMALTAAQCDVFASACAKA